MSVPGVTDQTQRQTFLHPIAGGQGVDHGGTDGGLASKSKVRNDFREERGGFDGRDAWLGDACCTVPHLDDRVTGTTPGAAAVATDARLAGGRADRRRRDRRLVAGADRAGTSVAAGLARDLTRFLPDCVTVDRRLRRDPRVPLRAKVAVGVAVLWALSPVDLIPEFLPVIGPLDDVVVVALVLRYAARSVPRDVLLEPWPGNLDPLTRLIGRKRE